MTVRGTGWRPGRFPVRRCPSPFRDGVIAASLGIAQAAFINTRKVMAGLELDNRTNDPTTVPMAR